MTEGKRQGVPADLQRLAASVVVPEALTALGLRQRFGDPQQVEVAAGQVWRARWEDVALLVLLLDVRPTDVLVVPVTVDPPGEDERSLTLEASSTVLGQPATVWAGLAWRLPLCVLDRLLDILEHEIVTWCQSVGSGRSGVLPAGARAGERIASPFEPAAEVCAQLEDDLALLAAATWVPVADPSVERRELRELLGGDLGPQALQTLTDALHVSLPEVVELVRGERPLSVDQAEALAAVAGQPTELLLASVEPLPQELVAELDHPRWRPAIRRRAERLGRGERQARLDIAYGTRALVARQTGPAVAPSWRDRLARYLEADGDLEGTAP